MPDTVDVSGTILIDGKPVEGVEVNFVSDKEKFAGYGKTDAQGKYTLVQGAVPGPNKVWLRKLESGQFQVNVEEGMDQGQFEAMAGSDPAMPTTAQAPKQLIPADFSDPKNPKLTYVVPEGGTESADFKINP